jgi:hypothetical protein
MINTRFQFNKDEYTVWGEYSTDQVTGVVTWMCRSLWTDCTIYMTTWDINSALSSTTREERKAEAIARQEAAGGRS